MVRRDRELTFDNIYIYNIIIYNVYMYIHVTEMSEKLILINLVQQSNYVNDTQNKSRVLLKLMYCRKKKHTSIFEQFN